MMKYLTITLLVLLFSGDIKEKKKKKKALKKKKKKKPQKMNSYKCNWSFSELFYLFSFVPSTRNLKKNSRKSTNKKILA